MQRYSSAFDATGGMQVKDDDNGLYVLYADALERERVLREALQNMVIMCGRPKREEWLNNEAFEDAVKIFEEARAAAGAVREGER